MEQQTNIQPEPGKDSGNQSLVSPGTGEVDTKQLRHFVEIKSRRNWKEYALEFILIVVAVFLGFFADSVRERREDRQKEKRYMSSLLRDIELDTTLSIEIGRSIFLQSKEIDSLEQFLLKVKNNEPGASAKCYLYARASTIMYPQFFHERTITQLLSSGSMRLIENQEVGDRIMEYYSDIKFLEMVRQEYLNSIRDCQKSFFDIFNIVQFRSTFDDTGELVSYDPDFNSPILDMDNDATFLNFFTCLENAKREAFSYAKNLAGLAEKGIVLHTFLKKYYRL